MEFWGTYLFGGACFWMSGYWYAKDKLHQPPTPKPKTTPHQSCTTQCAVQDAIKNSDLAFQTSQQNLTHAYVKVGLRKQEIDQERKTLTEMDQELRRRYWKWDMAGGPEYWRFSPDFKAGETKNILADCVKVQKRQQEMREDGKALEIAEKELRRRIWAWEGYSRNDQE